MRENSPEEENRSCRSRDIRRSRLCRCCGKSKWNSEWKDDPASLQGNADHRTDVLPLEEGIRRPEIGSSETIKGGGEGEWEAEATGGGAVFGEADTEGCSGGKLLSPERRKGAVEHACRKYGVSEREAIYNF
jgi:hypothetical protein